MGIEQPPEWYDRIFQSSENYAKSARDAPWYPLWQQAVEWVEGREPVAVVELGCGPGHLAELLRENPGVTRYVGYDFSPVAIEMAKERVQEPHFRFECRDLTKAPVETLSEPAVYLCCEFLEHIQPDLEILLSLPVGAHVFFTVPSQNDAGHVRWFPNVSAVKKRYGRALASLTVTRLSHWHYTGHGVRKA